MFATCLLLVLLAGQGCALLKGKALLNNGVVEERRELERLLIDILVNSLRPYKCIAIICDSVYYDVFRDTVFRNLRLYLSYFMILVEDSDDLLNPYPETQESLSMIRRQDCQTYIVLISNGLQTARFLQFGDRYRVLDTRANFIILYDSRLFNKELYYIWKRIVNVIFIREYLGVKKLTNGERKVIPWFELSTVPFPSPIRGILVPRRLDIWRQNKFRVGVDLFKDKTSDLRNQSMKVATFQHVPAAVRMEIPEFQEARSILPDALSKKDNAGFSGVEVEILATVAKAMNFFPELYELENGEAEKWGDKQLDGPLSGLFGELISSRAEIGLGDFYYTPFILNIMDLTVPYTTECLTFLTPEALTDNSWKTLILPFKPMMWLCVILSIFISSFLLYCLAQFHLGLSKENVQSKDTFSPPKFNFQALEPNEKYTVMKSSLVPAFEDGDYEGLNIFGERINSILYTYSMILMVSLPKLPSGWSLRMLTGWYWLYCILVVVSYRASMTAILANPSPRVTIDTLQELVDSDIAIGGWGEINRNFFLTSLDAASQVIGNRYEQINNTNAAVAKVAQGKLAVYENVHFLKQASVSSQIRNELSKLGQSSNGSNPVDENMRNLHIMSNCVINMPISIGLQKNSPIKPRIDTFIRRVIEAGLIRKWLDDVMQTTLNSEISNDGNPVALMSMQKFIGAIVALLIGYFISICTLLIELAYHKRFVANHPKYNRYSKMLKK